MQRNKLFDLLFGIFLAAFVVALLVALIVIENTPVFPIW